MNPEPLLTLKDVAEAISVSESSLRRWADDGKLHVMRTVGGHRRIALSEAIRFIRDNSMIVVKPDRLGLPYQEQFDNPDKGLFELLSEGEITASIAMICGQYLCGQSLADIFDGPMRDALTRLGELWKDQREEGVMIEHRATAICLQAIGHLKQMIPTPIDHAPTAVGGGPDGDPYLLPSMMAACVLKDAGYHTVNLGPQTPIGVMLQGIGNTKARLSWLAIMSPRDHEPIDEMLQNYGEKLAAYHCTLVVGGRQVPSDMTSPHERVQPLASMNALHAYCRSLKNA